MIESFVDLTYRGLSLGRRVKLTQVRPTTGYVETPAPMPVGTAISIATDEGLVFDATVTGIHEQVGGSDKAPGMIVAPALADDARQSWWNARVALPEEPPPVVARTSSVTVRPRTHTVPQPLPPDAVLAAAADAVRAATVPDGDATLATAPIEPEEPGGRTTIMEAIDPEMLERMTRTSGEMAAVTGEHAVIDDGKKTMLMDAIDPAALGLEVTGSGPIPTATDDDDNNDDPRKSSPAIGGAVKKRKKKR